MTDGERLNQSEIMHQQEEHGDDGPAHYKIITIRLRAAEYDALCETASALGLSRNLALRIAVRRIGGFLEIDKSVREQLEQGIGRIGEISTSIRALHCALIERGHADMDELARQGAAFGDAFAALDAHLRAILNISRRRSDGSRKLTESMA